MSHAFNHFIVLSGEAGSGKDSTADVLVSDHSYRKISLADGMKKFAADVFGWSEGQLWGPSSMRNAVDPEWARPCGACDGSGYQLDVPIRGGTYCLTCAGDGKINDNSPRRVLQLLGDEWGRQMIHPDIWSLAIKKELLAHLSVGHRIVVSDARFDNDRQNLSRWFGAKLVDVRAATPKNDGEKWRLHASELSRPKEGQIDYVIKNNEEWPFPNLHRLVTAMLLELYEET